MSPRQLDTAHIFLAPMVMEWTLQASVAVDTHPDEEDEAKGREEHSRWAHTLEMRTMPKSRWRKEDTHTSLLNGGQHFKLFKVQIISKKVPL